MSTSSAPHPNRYRIPILTAAFFAVVQSVLTGVLFYVGSQDSNSSLLLAGVVTLFVALASVISGVLIWRGKIKAGAWVFILGISIGIPLISLNITGLGWFGIFAIPIFVVWFSSQTLDSNHLRWALALGLTSGILNLLIDIFGPVFRPPIPYANIILPVVATILIIIAILILRQRFQSFTLQTKLSILFLSITLIPVGFLAFINNQSTRNSLTEATNQSLFSIGAQTTNQIDSFINNTVQSLEAEAQFTGLRKYLTHVANGDFPSSTDAVASLTTLARKDSAHILTYALLDRDGGVRVTYPVIQTPQNVDIIDVVPPFMGVSFAVENGIRTSLVAGLTYVSPVLFDENNQASIFFVTPVYNILEHTSPVGMLLVEYDANILQYLMENQNELAGVDSFGVLFDENQLHIAHGTDPSTLYKIVAPLPLEDFERLIEDGRLPNVPYEEHSTALPDLSEKLSNAAAEPFFTAIDVATGDRINQVAVVRLDTQRWQVGFFQPQDAYLSIANLQARNAIIFLAIIAVIVTALSLWATRLISTPIVQLTDIVEHVAAGNLALQVPVLTKDEIGRLATAFNAMTSQVRSLLGGLELQVAERTKDLERQAVQLQTAAEVARDASTLQDIDELLNRTVNLVHDRFGFYHAGIFLLDERNEFAFLRAANSEGGQEMLRQGHRLKVGQTGLVGYVTSSGEPRIALDVDTDAVHFAHRLLPKTRSEVALPLIVAGNIIGALDIQSIESNAFDEGDITVLQVLADQLAVAIENTHLLAEVRQTVHELQTAYGEFTQESWQRWIGAKNRPTGFTYRGTGIEPAIERTPEAILAFKQGQMITKSSDRHSNEQSALAVPIRLRDQTFGVINLRFEGDEVPAEMISLIDNISDRLATSLESARLYEETLRRAAQEQLTGEIATRIRETLDIDAVLKTAVQEIGQKLDLYDISIQLDTEHNSTPERES